MRCEEVMKRGVEWLNPQETAQVAARKMRDANIGFLPVCDQQGKILGTLTDRDLAIRLIANNKATSTAVGDLMTREVISCKAHDDIRRAEQLMGQNQKSRILCVDDNDRLTGVISLSDIIQHEDSSHAVETLRQVTEREAHPA